VQAAITLLLSFAIRFGSKNLTVKSKNFVLLLFRDRRGLENPDEEKGSVSCPSTF